MEPVRLNIGCGKDIKKGYINIDSQPHDGVDVVSDARRLPYEDFSVDEIYAAHIIEHFMPFEIGHVINEWKRVLKPGGKMVLIYPDIEKTCKVWLEQRHRRQRLMHNFVGTPWWEGHTHLWGWYAEATEAMLSKLGMINISSEPSDSMPDITDTCTMTTAYREGKVGPDYSIIIPVWNRFDEYTKPCIDSIKHYSKEDYEIIVIDNGSTEENRAKMQALADTDSRISVYFYDEPLGYSKATNEGIKKARAEYIILLNNDTLVQGPEWIPMLRESVDRPNAGISGPLHIPLHNLTGKFVVFFCAMVRREVFDKIGLLDESFGVGGCEDCAFCIMAEKAGYTLEVAGTPTDQRDEDGRMIGSFPLWHKCEGTVHHEMDPDKWKEIFNSNVERLASKFPERKQKPEEKMFKPKTLNPLHSQSVTVVIPTRDRYDTLAHTLRGLAFQTYSNFNITIVDNSDSRQDIRDIPMIRYQLEHLESRSIEWKVLYQNRKGPHICHQTGDYDSQSDLILRMDDDEVPEQDVIELLVRHFGDPDVGAVAPLVLMPGAGPAPKHMDMRPNLISHIVAGTNIQWFKHSQEDVIWENDHLYSCYMYRRNVANMIGGYNTTLSAAGHREETDFSYRIMMAGYALGVDTSAIVWHYRQPDGGIRSSEISKEMFDSDDKQFWDMVVNSKDKMLDIEFVPMFVGIGDHITASSMLHALKESKPDSHIIVGASAPDLVKHNPYVYDVWPYEIVKRIAGSDRNIYKRGYESEHTKTLQQIWCEEYGVSDHYPIEVYIPEEDDKWAREVIPSDQKVVLLAPFSTQTIDGKKSSYKDWEDEKWRLLIKRLRDKGFRIWQLGTMHETKLGADEFVSVPLNKAIALVKYCHTFVSVDTWIQHAGKALGKRGVVLWGETDERIFGYPDFHTNIREVDPNPAKQWLFNTDLDNSKMREIIVDDVEAAVENI